jgi:PKD repeat protein
MNRKIIRVVFFILFLTGIKSSCQACSGTVAFSVNSSKCAGNSVFFANHSKGIDSTFTWVWGDGQQLTTPDSAYQSHIYAVAQNYTVMLIARHKAPALCTDTFKLSVAIHADPLPPVFTIAQDSACGLSKVVYTIQNPIESHYSWDFGDYNSGGGNFANGGQASHIYNPGIGASNISYSVTATAYSTYGCQSGTMATIKAKQILKSNLVDQGGSFASCSINGQYQLVVSDGSNAGLVKNYTIKWGDGTADFSQNSILTNVQHQYTAQGEYKLLYLVTGNNSCVDSTSFKVSNLKYPSVRASIIGNSSNSCAPEAISFLIDNIQGNDPSTIYSVNFGDGTSEFLFQPKMPQDTIKYAYLNSTCVNNSSFVFTITAKNRCDIIKSSVGGIRVYTRPKADFNVSKVTCLNNEILFTNNSQLGYNNSTCSRNTSFTWNFGDGSPAVSYTSVTDPLSANTRHTYTAVGDYTVSLIASSPQANLCGNDTLKKSIHVYPLPIVQAAVNANGFCKGNSATLSARGNALTYAWKPSNLVMNPSDSTTLTTPLNTTTFTVVATSKNNCKDSASTAVNILPLPDFVLSPKAGAICKDSTISLSAQGSAADPGIGFAWSPATSLNFNSGPVVKANPSTTTTYVVTATGSNTCVKKDSIVVQVNLPPVVSISGATSICTGDSTVLTAHGATTYIWTPATGLKTASGASATVLPSAPSTYTVKGVNPTGCNNKASFNISVMALPSLLVSPDTVICAGASAKLSASGNGINFQWAPSQNLVNANSPTAVAKPVNSTTYTVLTSSSQGCHKSGSIRVNVNPLPKSFPLNSTVVCKGGGTNIGVASISGHSYEWHTATTAYTSALAMPFVQPDTTSTYYLKEIIDATQCQNFDTAIVKVNAYSAIHIQPFKQRLCSDDSLVILIKADMPGTSIKWTAQADPGLQGAMDGSGNTIRQKLINTTNSVKSVRYKIDYSVGQCISQPIQVTVMVDPWLHVSAGDSLSSTCQNAGKYTLQGASPAGGIWHGTAISDTIRGIVDPLNAGPGSYIFTYTMPDTTHSVCPLSATKKFKIFQKPTADFSLDSLVCTNDSIKVKGNTSLNAIKYRWDFGDKQISVGFLPAHVYKDTINAKVMLVAISQDACMDTAYRLIAIKAVPKIQIFTNPKSGCEPLVVNFANQSVGYQTTYTWTLTKDSVYTGFAPPAFTFKAGLSGDTLYPIQVTANNFCGSRTFKDSIAVAAFPKSNFRLSQNSGCSPLSISFANLTPGNPKSFVWNFMDGSPNYTGNNPGSHIFKTGLRDTLYNILLIASNQCGTDTAVQTLLLHTNNVHAFINTDVDKGCEPLNVTFNNYSTGQTNSSWDFGDQTTASGDLIQHVFAAGRYNVKLYASNGCSFDTAVKNIQVYPGPVLTFNLAKDSFCLGETIIFANAVNTLATYAWKFGNGDSSNASTPHYAYANAGTYTVEFSAVSDSFSCKNTITKNIDIMPLPSAVFSLSDSIGCQPFLVRFNPLEQNLIYRWSFGDGLGSGAASPQNVYNNAGTFTAHLEVENGLNCKAVSEKKIVVKGKPAIAFDAGKQSSCQFPLPVSFVNKSTNADSFKWLFGNGDTSTIDNPKTVYSQPGQYKVTLIGRNLAGCVDSLSKTIGSSAPVKASFGLSDSIGCAPLSVKFNNTSSANAIKSTWYFGDDIVATNTSSHTYQNAGTYIVSLKVNSDYCSDSVSYPIPVTVLQRPSAAFHYTDLDDPSRGRIQLSNTTLYGSKYLWHFGDAGQSSETSPLHIFEKSGLYRVVLMASNNFCQDSIVQMVRVSQIKSLFIPNAFTPESGTDEVRKFTPKGKGLQSYHISIFNLWGTLLWESSALQDGSPTESWNGYYQEVLSPEDAYVWKVEATFLDGTIWQGQKMDGEYKTTGTVTLIK